MKVRYSRLYSLGNYENEKVEVEEDFGSNIPYGEALTLLMKLVNKDHEIRVRIREVNRAIEQAEHSIKVYTSHNTYEGASFNPEEDANRLGESKQMLAKLKRQLRKLNKELLEV